MNWIRARSRMVVRGQAMVEFALVAMLFFFFVMVIVDLGRGIWYYNAVANAAREGSRQAIIRSKSDNDVTTWVLAKTVGVPLSASSIVISPAAPRTAKTPVTVTVTYSFTPISPMMQSIIPGGALNLSSSSEMTVEW